MKIMIRLLIVGLASMTALASAEDESAFGQMKQMEGSWEGMLTRSTGEVVETRSTFRLISDGNTMVETLVEDGVEMLTTYSEQDGQLKVTHYWLCVQRIFRYFFVNELITAIRLRG